MDLDQLLDDLDDQRLGREIYAFAERAYPICRSITGNGVRETLELLGEWLPLTVHEVPTGTPVLDWTVPEEWNLERGWIRGPAGETIVDTADHNLHVLGYSEPVHRRLSLDELRPHLLSDPNQPDRIPYRTSYYQRRWGFCLPHRQLESLPEGEYEVRIDAVLGPGHLTYGESIVESETVEGETVKDETAASVHLSAHVCHPSLANDNLSGLGVLAALGAQLHRLVAAGGRLRHTYRVLFAPGTIGAITWLARNREAARRIRHGLVAANLGDGGVFHYKRSRRGDAAIDRAVERVLADAGEPFEVEDFIPFGYDERQYCSPGFDLPVGSLTRTPWGRYGEYHTSGDDLELVRPEHLGRSLRRYLEVVRVLENDRRYRNLEPYGEPQLGSRGLYSTLGGGEEGRERQLALLWVLNLSDGEHSLLDVCRRSGLSFDRVLAATRALLDAELLEPLPDDESPEDEALP